MNKLAKAMMLLSSAVLMVGLSACGDSTPEPAEPTVEPTQTTATLSNQYNNDYLFETHKKLSDGRTVLCMVYHEYQEGGVTCDWANAHR